MCVSLSLWGSQGCNPNSAGTPISCLTLGPVWVTGWLYGDEVGRVRAIPEIPLRVPVHIVGLTCLPMIPPPFRISSPSSPGAYRRSYLLAYDPSTGACHCSYLLGPARISGLHNTALTCLAVLCSFSLVISADSRRRSVCTTCSSISTARSAPSGFGCQLNMPSSSS